MQAIVDRLVEVVSAPPDAVLPATATGARRPSNAGEVPAIAVGLTVDTTHGTPLRRFIRRGEAGDVLGDTYGGAVTLELWATTSAQVADLSRKLQARLKAGQDLLRQKGFAQLHPAGLEPAENVLVQPVSGSTFAVWKQRLTYRFVFESEEEVELSAGGPIRRIDVDIPNPTESFSIP